MGKLEELEIYTRVVEAGGISKAAEQLNVAKSAVSKRLSDLEQRLGTQLINRTTRTSSLTEAGAQYYQQAIQLLEQVERMDTVISDSNQLLTGTLRLALPNSFGLDHLTPAIDLFCQQHPELNIELHFSDRTVDLVEEGIDLAIRIGELHDSSLQAKRICPIHTQLCASPDYLKKWGEPKTPEELLQHQFLQYSGTRQALYVTDSQGQKIPLHRFIKNGLNIKIQANNGHFLRDMAIAGHGIIYSPTFICWQSLCSQELVPVLTHYKTDSMSAFAIYPKNRFLAKKSRLFITFLTERFGKKPYWDQYN